jgi:hypothetical protein
MAHMVRSILHPAFRRHLYTGQVTSQWLLWAMHIINYRCNKALLLEFWANLSLPACPRVCRRIDGGLYWFHCGEE